MDRYKMAFHKMLSGQDEGKWKGKVSVVDQLPPFLFSFIWISLHNDRGGCRFDTPLHLIAKMKCNTLAIYWLSEINI